MLKPNTTVSSGNRHSQLKNVKKNEWLKLVGEGWLCSHMGEVWGRGVSYVPTWVRSGVEGCPMFPHGWGLGQRGVLCSHMGEVWGRGVSYVPTWVRSGVEGCSMFPHGWSLGRGVSYVPTWIWLGRTVSYMSTWMRYGGEGCFISPQGWVGESMSTWIGPKWREGCVLFPHEWGMERVYSCCSHVDEAWGRGMS